MNEKWTDQLQSKLDGLKTMPDESLWLKISEDKRLVPTLLRYNPARWLWIPAVAASLLLFLKPVSTTVNEPTPQITYKNNYVHLESAESAYGTIPTIKLHPKQSTTRIKAEEPHNQSHSPNYTAEVIPSDDSLNTNNPGKIIRADEDNSNNQMIPVNIIPEEIDTKPARKPVLSLFAQLSPFGNENSDYSSNSSSQKTPLNPGNGTGPTYPGQLDGGEGTEDDSNNGNPIMRLPSRRTVGQDTGNPDATYTHLFPVQAGLRVSLDLSDRFGLESGLSYLLIQSIIGEKTQRLHYIGIPLHAYYNAVRTGPLSFYTSAGAQVYKCIAGNGPDKPWLFASDIAAGVDLRISPVMSLYAEPGLSYSYSTGTSVHYYSENPFAFTVSAGVRFRL